MTRGKLGIGGIVRSSIELNWAERDPNRGRPLEHTVGSSGQMPKLVSLKFNCPYLPDGLGCHTIRQNGCTELAGYGNL